MFGFSTIFLSLVLEGYNSQVAKINTIIMLDDPLIIKKVLQNTIDD